MTTFTAAEVALEFRCSKRKITDLASRLGVGANIGGSAGFRFTEAEKRELWEAMKPAVVVARRRKRRAS